ncbi:hypothetical protein BgiBS90_002239 [Biomphalaria glabrata]|nr:hypothetical protein BgiBS90_002239 [Biomphalaria glabrata]
MNRFRSRSRDQYPIKTNSRPHARPIRYKPSQQLKSDFVKAQVLVLDFFISGAISVSILAGQLLASFIPEAEYYSNCEMGRTFMYSPSVT